MDADTLHRNSDRAEDENRSFAHDVRGLADDTREYVGKEISFQKARFAYVAGLVPAIAFYAVLAFLFVFFALGGLVVGLILALAPLLTPWGSMATVCVTLLIGATVCVLLAWRRWSAVTATFAAGADL